MAAINGQNCIDGRPFIIINTMIILFFLLHTFAVEAVVVKPDSLEKSFITGIKLELDGVVVCDAKGAESHDSKWVTRIKRAPSIQQVIDVLGAGYVSPTSGTGGIRWYFSDGSMYYTEFFPMSLEQKVRFYTPDKDTVIDSNLGGFD